MLRVMPIIKVLYIYIIRIEIETEIGLTKIQTNTNAHFHYQEAVQSKFRLEKKWIRCELYVTRIRLL